MTDISVIILTKNEKLHIQRCLERLKGLAPQQLFIVDCFSTDGTQEIARQMSAIVVEHEWPGNQALQFNWALDNLLIEAGWVLRLDADEWLTDELIKEIKEKLPTLPKDVDGVLLKRRHYFSGRWVKFGTYPIHILRLFRTGMARYDDDMAMDEHLIVKGRTIEFEHDFVDESLISIEEWKEKHRGYAKRESRMVVEGKVNKNKLVYYKLPPYIRAFIYFCIRYFLKLGFLNGLSGFRWHFWQGLWYRCLVDREIGRLKKETFACRRDMHSD